MEIIFMNKTLTFTTIFYLKLIIDITALTIITYPWQYILNPKNIIHLSIYLHPYKIDSGYMNYHTSVVNGKNFGSSTSFKTLRVWKASVLGLIVK